NQGKEKGYQFERRPKAIPRRVIGERWNQGDIHAAWLDFDNDGLQDLMLASSDYPDGQFLQLFRQKADHSFENVSFEAGLYFEGAAQLSFADYDGDGDLDILIGNSFHRLPGAIRKGRKRKLTVFENKVGQKNHWIQFQLIGKGPGGSNRSAIGARVTIRCGKTRMMREIRSSLGHAGHGEFPRAHFGLGAATEIDRIEVRWPNSSLSVQVFDKKVPANRFVTLREGDKELKVSEKRGQ
ncbi:MAG: CRTAC1 family protein, partial [Planctomycetota bacterium]|nr:CRTAC1 family protein [Planctomycetota bacterium]